MDAFFVSIEIRDNPALADKPVAVGGSSTSRGVLSTCNYIARQFGIHSAMPTSIAMRKCPSLIIVNGRMDVYKSVSDYLRQIFARYTHIIEPLSLDEAFLDVSESKLFDGSATLIAEDIRRAIFNETKLTASAGVAPCKFVAKIASDENKPDGICVIPPQKLDNFVRSLPLGKIPGVGKVTLEKLHNLGLYNCNDVRQFPFEQLVRQFGKFGPVIWDRSHGIDQRELSINRQRKSVGVEHTLPDDINSKEDCLQMAQSLYPKLLERLKRSSPELLIHSQGVKLKFSDFQTTTVEHRCSRLDKGYFNELIEEAFSRRSGRRIRLIGLQVGLPGHTNQSQLCFPFAQHQMD